MAFFSELQFSKDKFLEIRSSVTYITCMVAVAVFTVRNAIDNSGSADHRLRKHSYMP